MRFLPSRAPLLFLTFALSACSSKSGGFQGKSNRLVTKPAQVAPVEESLPTRAPATPASVAPNPCASQSGVAVNADKKIFFYAPADSHGGSPYYLGAKEALEASGYEVRVGRSLKDSVVDFNECSLWANYKQVWLWLPCKDDGETQSMDEAGLQALRSFHEAGGGLVVFNDYHFNNGGCYHCSPADWGTSADVVAVKNLLGIEYDPTLFYTLGGVGTGGWGHPAVPAGVHPLSRYAGKLKNLWGTKVRAGAGVKGTFFHLDAGQSIAIIEENTATRSSMAFVAAAAYGYEFSVAGHIKTSSCEGWTGSYDSATEAGIFPAVADYFEMSLRAPRTGAVAAMNLTETIPVQQSVLGLDVPPDAKPGDDFDIVRDANPFLLAGLTKALDPQGVIETLLTKTRDANPLLAGMAIRDLAKSRVFDLDDLVRFFEHPRFPVRYQTALAIAALEDRRETVKRLSEMIGKQDLGRRKLQGVVRALAFIGDKEALPALRSIARASLDGELRHELEFTIATLERLR